MRPPPGIVRLRFTVATERGGHDPQPTLSRSHWPLKPGRRLDVSLSGWVPRAIRDQLIARGLLRVELDPRVCTPGLDGILGVRFADKFKTARPKPAQKAVFDQVTEGVLNGPPARYAAGVARI